MNGVGALAPLPMCAHWRTHLSFLFSIVLGIIALLHFVFSYKLTLLSPLPCFFRTFKCGVSAHVHFYVHILLADVSSENCIYTVLGRRDGRDTWDTSHVKLDLELYIYSSRTSGRTGHLGHKAPK